VLSIIEKIHITVVKFLTIFVILLSLFVAIILAFSVFFRFFLTQPLSWDYELVLITFHWLVMAAFPLYLQRSLPSSSTSITYRARIAILAQLLFLAGLGAFGVQYVIMMKGQLLFQLPISARWQGAAIPFGCFAACLTLLHPLFSSKKI
jgi:TRAP-type C4-dicarboxylate transport system permease small subunit